MCRRPHGAGFVTWVGVPPAQFQVNQGVEVLKTYVSSEHGRRQFCGECGSQLFCWHVREGQETPDVIDVTLASLHDPIDRQPQAHFFYDAKASWTVVNDDLPKLGGVDGLQPLSLQDHR
jgi:hypothetical protein